MSTLTRLICGVMALLIVKLIAVACVTSAVGYTFSILSDRVTFNVRQNIINIVVNTPKLHAKYTRPLAVPA